MSRPSDDFEPDELKEEYDWLYEFESHMAERITHDPDVHNLVDYVNKLESENAKLRTLLSYALILTGFNERQYLDKYLREEEGTTLFRELKSVGIEVS
jgi:hypothetical protein